MLNAVKWGSAALLALAVVGSGLAFLLAGIPGVWGALIGAALGGLFILATAGSILVGAKTSATNLAMIVLGGWLLKLIFLVVALAVLRNYYFYNRVALFAVVCGAVAVVLGSEVMAVLKTKVTYVQPE